MIAYSLYNYDVLLEAKLDIFQSLVEEEEFSPSEYYRLVHSVKTKTRKRATKSAYKPHRRNLNGRRGRRAENAAVPLSLRCSAGERKERGAVAESQRNREPG